LSLGATHSFYSWYFEKHKLNDGLLPVEYEKKYFQEAEKCLANEWRFSKPHPHRRMLKVQYGQHDSLDMALIAYPLTGMDCLDGKHFLPLGHGGAFDRCSGNDHTLAAL
jgi:hypothetical protein